MKNRITKFKWAIIATILLIGISIVLISIFYSSIYCHILNNGSLGVCPARNFIYNGKPFLDWRGITTNWIQSDSIELWSNLSLVLGVGAGYLLLNLFIKKVDKGINEKFSKGLILTLIISILSISYLSAIWRIKYYKITGNILGFSGISFAVLFYSLYFLFYYVLNKINSKWSTYLLFISLIAFCILLLFRIGQLTINVAGHIFGTMIGLILAYYFSRYPNLKNCLINSR